MTAASDPNRDPRYDPARAPSPYEERSAATPSYKDLLVIEDGLRELAALALTYERRLIFKGRDAVQARSAARAYGRAEDVVRRAKAVHRAAA